MLDVLQPLMPSAGRLNCGAKEVEFRAPVPVSTLNTSKKQKRKVTHKVKKPEKKLRFSSLISLYTLSFSRDSPKKAFLLLEEAPEKLSRDGIRNAYFPIRPRYCSRESPIMKF